MPAPRDLFIVRHAIAAERSEKWPDDSKRPLTHSGASRWRFGVRGLSALRPEIDVVLTSPLVRAAQTAEILVKGLDPKPELATLPVLAPGGTPSRIAEALATYNKARGVAVVGHEPGLGELAAWLIGARSPLPFKKGAVCRIRLAEWPPAPKEGTLIWFATPKMLRTLD